MRFPLALVDRVVADEVDVLPAASVSPDVESLEERLVAPEVAAQPDLALSIAGNVLNEAGDPVEGVELAARAIRVFHAGAGTSGNQPEVRTRSDVLGSYRLGPLAPGEYRVHSLATDRYGSAHIVARSGVDFANFVLNEKGEVAVYGTVTDVEGMPLAAVTVTQAHRSGRRASTDQDGQYRIRLALGGQDEIHALRFELEYYAGKTKDLSNSRIRGRDELRLDARLESLESLAAVEGRVSNQAGAAVSGETVFLVGEEHYQSVTDQAGQFSIRGVDADTTYQLWISPRGPYEKYNEKVRVGAEGRQLEVILESASVESASVSGRMIDAGGKPVPGFDLWIRSSNGSAAKPLLATSDAAGLFSASGVPLGRLTFTTLADPRLTINGPELSAAGAENVDLVVDSGGHEIRGRVLDSYGSPVAAPRLTLEWSHPGGGLQSLSLRRTTGDAYGYFAFTQVGPGPHSLSVTAPGFLSRRLNAESASELVVELQADSQREGLGGQ